MSNALLGLSSIQIPRDDTELKKAIQEYCNISVPDKQICEGHSTPFRALSNAFFARNSIEIWKASRAFGGKSVTLATLGYMEVICWGAYVNLLGGSGQQSKRVHEYMTGEDTNLPGTFWGAPGAPTHLLIGAPTGMSTKLRNRGKINVLMASQTSVRGPHPQRLRLDEVDEMPEKIFEAAMGQTMEARGIPPQTVISSTHQHADGVMTKALQMANERGWTVHEWCWKETLQGWLTQASVEAKKKEVTDAMWNTEFDLQEPDPAGRAIVTSKVEEMFQRSLGDYLGSENDEIIIEEPREGAEYCTGADWAKETNWSIIWTFRIDVFPIRLVAFGRYGRRPYPQMVERFNQRIRKYPGEAFHDATGLGDVIDDYIEEEAVGIVLTGARRKHILNNFVVGIEDNQVVAPYIEFAYNEFKYAKNDDLYGGGHLPDSLCAGALAYIGATTGVWVAGVAG